MSQLLWSAAIAAAVLVLTAVHPAAGAQSTVNCSPIYSGGGWAIDSCPWDPQVSATMRTRVGGISMGTASLVRISHASQAGPGTPQVAVIYASGVVRLKQNADPDPPLPFGGSFVLGPAYWSSATTYYASPVLTDLDIDASWLPDGPLRLRAAGSNHDFAVEYEMTLPQPRDRQARLHVTQTSTTLADLSIDRSRQIK